MSHMHMSCEKTCNMQHRAKKRAKTMQNHAMQNHAKTMQKTSCSTCCKKQAVPHAKTMQHARTLASTPGKWRGREATQAGAAGWRSAKPYDRMIRMIRMTRRAGVSGKNMFIRHVLRHVEIKRFWWLGAAETWIQIALVLALVLKKLSI